MHISMFIVARGGVTVWVDAPTDVIMSRLHVRGDELIGKSAQVEEIRAGYQDMWTSFMIDFMCQPGSPGTLDNGWAADIIRLARAHETWAQRVAALRSYVGSPSASTWYVGDHYGGSMAHRHTDVPCFAPMPSTSGAYLLRALDMPSNTLLPLTIGIVNSTEPLLRQTWQACGEPKLVALGVKAHDRLTALALPHHAVPHPQYWRRFHHGDINRYRDLLLHGNEVPAVG